MKKMQEVIQFWKSGNHQDLYIGVDVSVRTAKALQKRGIARYHKTTEKSDARISLSPTTTI